MSLTILAPGPGGDGENPEPALTVVAEILASGGEAISSFRNVAIHSEAQGIIDDALAAFGRIDGVVNNAGVVRDSIFHKMEEKDWDVAIAVNLKGSFNVSRAAAPHFKAQNSGAFVQYDLKQRADRKFRPSELWCRENGI